MTRRTTGVLLAVSLLVAVACGDGDDGAPTATSPETAGNGSSSTTGDVDATTTAVPDRADQRRPLDQIALALEPVGEFEVPTAYRVHPDGSGWVAEKAGRVRSAETGDVALDVTGSVRDHREQGFLGIEFSPDGDLLYVDYTDRAGTTIIAEYPFADGRADPAGRREILQVEQPFANHNAGDIRFGPDGFFYVTLGDGGGSGDPHRNAQDPSTLLGSILRIDPSAPADDRPYGIPDDNPFADGGGRPEIHLVGVRNPWRIAFDDATGDLWVADVGQDAWEEINVLPADEGRGRGANLGWPAFEGTHRFDDAVEVRDPVFPIHEYSHEQGGCSITGGSVYRGDAIPALDGAYFFADLCQTDLRAIRVEDGAVTASHSYPLDVPRVVSFGVDPDGELLVLTQVGTIHRIVSG